MLGLASAILVLLLFVLCCSLLRFSLPSGGLLNTVDFSFDFECFTLYSLFSECSQYCITYAWLITAWCQRFSSLSEGTWPPFPTLYHPSFGIDLCTYTH